MLYATQFSNLLLIGSATTLAEFEEFCGTVQSQSSYEAERADILDMLGNQMFKGYTLAPMKIDCRDEEVVADVIATLGLTLVRPRQGVDYQAEMLERERLVLEAQLPPDRRSLAEVHGLTENDPWDKSSDEQKEAGRKQDEQMRAVRDAGGLTGDSFAGSQGDKLNIHRATIKVGAGDVIESVDILASKNTVKVYDLVVDGRDVDWVAVWDELKIPENRILSTDGNHVVVKLHDFQVGEVAAVFDRDHRNYTINKQPEVDDGAEKIDLDITGYENIDVFYSVQIEQATVHEMVPLLESQGFNTSFAATMRNVGRGCWFAFIREHIALECADVARRNGHACVMIAINRHGQSIVEGGDSSIRVVDVNEKVEIGPRPWNDRAAELIGLTDDERAEFNKTVQGGEYLFTIVPHHMYKSVVYITPESHFRDMDELWTGEFILDCVPKDPSGNSVLKELSPGVYKSSMEPNLLKDNMCRFGFVESLLLRIHINNMMSDKG